jgi:acetolactate synthase-1/2/3 large subunit
VLVTSGPGATNGDRLTDALMDSIPLVCITGQVPTHLIGNDAFQECDTVGITRPCTKHNWLVKDVNDLARICTRPFTWRRRPSGPGRDRRARRISSSPPAPISRRARTRAHKTYRPRVKGDANRSARRGRPDGRRQEAGVLYRRRRHQLRPARLQAAARAGRG